MNPFVAALFMGSSGAVTAANVFDVDLWTGTSLARSITTPFAPDMVWIKSRSDATNFALFDTSRGAGNYLSSNTTTAQTTDATTLTAFNAGGYSLGIDTAALVNVVARTYVGWAFKKAASFFDVVPYVGTGSNPNWINHTLGAIPGLVIIKATGASTAWAVVARTTSGDYETLYLNTTGASLGALSAFGGVSAYLTSTQVNVGGLGSVFFGPTVTNTSAAPYVAYVFAHDAGTNGLIQCGSFTTDGSGDATVSTLPGEPQWLIAKPASASGNWLILDQTRGWGGTDNALSPNTSGTESTATNYGAPTSGGFTFANGGASVVWNYMAIRKP